MRTSLIAMSLLIVPASSWAATPSLSGKWTLPDKSVAMIKQQRGGSAEATVELSQPGKPVKVRVSGSVAYARLGGDGGLGFTGTAKAFPIKWHGKRCQVKSARLAVLGDLIKNGSEREYRAEGSLHGYVHCGGKNTWERWVADLSGNWH